MQNHASPRLWFCGMLLTLLICLVSCTARQNVSSELTSHTTHLYTIGVPRSWQVRTFDDVVPILTLVSSEPISDDALFQNKADWTSPWFAVILPLEPNSLSPDAVQYLAPEENVLEEREVLIDGNLVREFIYEYDQDTQQFTGWTAVVLSECPVQLGFLLIAEAPSDEWEKFWPRFQAMRDSFETHGKWPDLPAVMTAYEGETFRINYYQDWETQSEEGRVYFGDALPLYHHFSVVVSLPLEMIPENLSESVYLHGTTVFEGSVNIAGREGYEYAAMYEGECAYIEWQAAVVGGYPPRLYSLHASASVDSWEQALPLIQEMRDSLEIFD